MHLLAVSACPSATLDLTERSSLIVRFRNRQEKGQTLSSAEIHYPVSARPAALLGLAYLSEKHNALCPRTAAMYRVLHNPEQPVPVRLWPVECLGLACKAHLVALAPLAALHWPSPPYHHQLHP